MQSAKAGGVAGDALALADIARDVINGMRRRALYLLGPGTTTRAIAERLGLPKTLLGVDAVRDGELVAADVSERQALELLDAQARAPTRIVVTVIGGQGYIFGRGNQQLSPAVIRAAGRRTSSSSPPRPSCSRSWAGRCSSTPATPTSTAQLAGYVKVVTGLDERTMYKVAGEGG